VHDVQSQKRKAVSSKSRHRGTSTERAVTWQQEAENVLQMIVNSHDSEPFRNAVNIDEFPVCSGHLLIYLHCSHSIGRVCVTAWCPSVSLLCVLFIAVVVGLLLRARWVGDID